MFPDVPIHPQAYTTQTKSVLLGQFVSVADVLKAQSEILLSFPEAMSDEMHIQDDQGGFDSDPYTEYHLVFSRTTANPNYAAQMIRFNEETQAYNHAAHEHAMRNDAAYRSRLEQQNARSEWKKNRRAERIANRARPTRTSESLKSSW